uniref:MBG domain-containing protein n=1 Tax=Streptococcus pneumoniae TaxID=1313 RepID=UPI0013DC163F
AKSRIYGAADPALTYQITSGNLVNGDQLIGSLTTVANTTAGVGSYAINQGTLGHSNYAITYVSANETITARQITVTADTPASRYYGDANPALTYTVGGLGMANGDTLGGALATSASSASAVGSYAITQG